MKVTCLDLDLASVTLNFDLDDWHFFSWSRWGWNALGDFDFDWPVF